MSFKKILCPTDFSQSSYGGLKRAVELASDANAEICVIHVEQPVAVRSPLDTLAPFAHTDAERRADTVANLCAIVAETVPASIRARPLLKTGDPAEEILRAARAEGADLIVLTTHGAGRAESNTLGRVAEQILRSAPCPVLTANTNSVEAVATSASNGASHTYDNMPAALEMVSSKTLFLDGD